MNLLNDESYMRLALQMAEQAQGQTGVNPVVGCVIVKEGRIIGMGAHLQLGSAHAEINALQTAGTQAEGSTVYVTLEPCSHYGRTSPCCDRLIAERVNRVVVAYTDPNPLVAGEGIRKLRDQGIIVEVGLLHQEAMDLNEIYNKYILDRMPFVSLKTASSLDGKIATAAGDSQWISNEQSRAFVHTLRHKHQAIMVGVNTVITDNPMLTARLPVPALQPYKVIVDSKLRIPEERNLLQDNIGLTIVLSTSQAPKEKKQRLESFGADVIICGDEEKVNLALAMKILGERGISSILLEGGGILNGAMLNERLIDKMYVFVAPIIVGGESAPANFSLPGVSRIADAIQLDRLKIESFANNVCFIGYPSYGDRK